MKRAEVMKGMAGTGRSLFGSMAPGIHRPGTEVDRVRAIMVR